MAYKQDPNDSSKMVPVVNNKSLVPHVTTPPSGTVQYRPSYVLIKDDKNGIQFCFHSTSSLGVDMMKSGAAAGPEGGDETWTDFGTTKIISDGGSLARLDISPVAWSGSGAATDYADGNVIFVYNNGKPS